MFLDSGAILHSYFIFQCSQSIWKMFLDSGAIQHSCFIFQYSPSILLKVSCCYDVAHCAHWHSLRLKLVNATIGGGKLHVAFCESNWLPLSVKRLFSVELHVKSELSTEFWTYQLLEHMFPDNDRHLRDRRLPNQCRALSLVLVLGVR